MAIIQKTWNDSLRIGVPLIDLQHKQLLDQMDRLIDEMKNKKDPQQIKSILGFLDNYVNNHFDYEESCMNLYKCPVGCQNKDAHAKFKKTLAEVHQQINQNRSLDMIASRVQNELLSWFVNHIKAIDTKLNAYVNK